MLSAAVRQCTDAERTELDGLLAREPKLKAEFARLQADVQTTKAAVPLVEATQAMAGELPAGARGRLQTKVREPLGRPAGEKEPDRSLAVGWRWVLGLAATAAVVLLVVLPMFRTPSAPVIQLALLDTAGGTRGSNTNEAAVLHGTWSTASLDFFHERGNLAGVGDEAQTRRGESHLRPRRSGGEGSRNLAGQVI